MDYQDEVRISRATKQRLYLIEKTWTKDKVSFDVMGSTGNVYIISCDESEEWKCTCPDHLKRNLDCKHIYFVKIRVLKDLDSWEDLQRANPENLKIDPSVLIQDILKQTYEKRKRSSEDASEETKEKKDPVIDIKKNWLDEECMVCCDPMTKEDEKELFTCSTCKQSIHGFCWQMWSKQKDTCVYCRSTCPVKGSAKKRKDNPNDETYINLLS